ncbi:hypothetical protein BGZ46_007971 [Entomortierella lignicola]|nr:hypothetical protein BGZ46_007971 [Entomortierella lignicola]
MTGTTQPSTPVNSTLSTKNSEDEQSIATLVSNAVSWLERPRADQSNRTPKSEEADSESTLDSSGAEPLPQSSSISIASVALNVATTAAAATKIQGRSPTQGFRRPSHTSIASTIDDDDSEIEDIAVPISVLTLNSSRLSRIHETGSTHMDEPQEPLLCSKKTEPDDQVNEGNKNASKRLTANITRSSILFSEFGLKVPDSELQTNSSSSLSSNIVNLEDKPLPRRPVSMFAEENKGQESDVTDSILPIALDTSARRNVSKWDSQDPSDAHAVDPELNKHSLAVGHGPAGARPATICVSSKVPHNLTTGSSPVSVTFIPIDMQPPQVVEKDGMEALAIRTSTRCFQEDTSFLPRDEIAIYLGQAKPFNRRVLHLYMNNFDFSRKRLDMAFRQLCQKLVLKGETQEVDRVLEVFAIRYVDCNPHSIFGTKDVVHAITYSILLLNTDLHVVQQSSSNKMSRTAFVKNTLQVVEAQTLQQSDDRASEDLIGNGMTSTRSKTDETGYGGEKKKTPSIKSWKSGNSHQSSKMGIDPKANGGHGNGKWWMSELESLLKDIYSSVKHNQILLPSTTSGSALTVPSAYGIQSSNSGGSSFLPRLPQIQPPSFTEASHSVFGSSNGNTQGSNGSPKFSVMGRRGSINPRTKQLRQDALQRLNSQYSSATPSGAISIAAAGSSEVKPEDSESNRTPTLTIPTSASLLNSHPTLPSPVLSVHSSMGTLQSSRPLENTIHSQNSSQFRMEGILHRKHLLERVDKKASSRSWRRLLVIIDQGGLSLFRADGQLGQAFEDQGILFDEIRLQHTITNILPPPGYSSSRKHVFAVQLYTGAVYLFQAATARECEEWARTCNYWAARTSKEPLVGGVVNMDYGWGRSLDLLNNSSIEGSDIVRSNSMKLTSSNPWSSPTIGATDTGSPALNGSNGLSDNISIPNLPLLPISADEDEAKSTNNSISAGANFLQHPPPPTSPLLPPISAAGSAGSGSMGASSYYGFGNSGIGSGRSASIKSSSSKYNGSSGSNVPLGDRVMLFDWNPPLPPMSMTVLSEEDQCESLKRYVVGLEAEMEVHQEHRGPMMQLFLPKSQNYSKAFNNWERRSRHLLKEMVKYQIYVECLEQSLKAQREERKVAAGLNENTHLEEELQHLEVEEELQHLEVEEELQHLEVEEELQHLEVEEELQHLEVNEEEDGEGEREEEEEEYLLEVTINGNLNLNP